MSGQGQAAPLPELLDCRQIMAETGLKRATVEALMREQPKQVIPGVRKNLVRREHVIEWLDRHLVAA